MTVWTKRDFCHISGIHSTTNLRTYEQAKNFFHPPNTQSSSEESLKEKCKTFIGKCFPFHTEFISWHRCTHNTPKYLKWSVLWRLKVVNYFCKILHLRCLKGQQCVMQLPSAIICLYPFSNLKTHFLQVPMRFLTYSHIHILFALLIKKTT